MRGRAGGGGSRGQPFPLYSPDADPSSGSRLHRLLPRRLCLERWDDPPPASSLGDPGARDPLGRPRRGDGSPGDPVSRRVVVSWSTGKDSAWCLHRLLSDSGVEVVGLLTTVTPRFARVSVHGTRLEVLQAQADGLGLPLRRAELPYPCPNEEYEAAMLGALADITAAWDATHVAFGDLFLEDIRAYREDLVEPAGVEPLFPLWGLETGSLAREMDDAGLKAVIVSAPETSPAAGLVGSLWSPAAIDGLEREVDPCGERGEFHTCVVASPELQPLGYEAGKTVRRDGAVYVDIRLVR